MVKVFDNFIGNSEVVDELWKYFLFGVSHDFLEISHDTSKQNATTVFYSTNFTLEDKFIEILYLRILNFLDLNPCDYNPYRIHTNIQHFGMGLNSGFHQDNREFTAVYFVSPNIEGGEFVYKETNIEKKVEYKKDRLLVFDGKVEHKGLPPNNFNARISLAFKVDKIC